MTYLLLSSQLLGGLCLVLLLTFCFFAVHLIKLVKFGWTYQKELRDEPSKEAEKKQEKPTPEPAREPIYYIVERKRRQAKSAYSKPKEIRFK
ncbi:MAG: hypothetical protein IJV85_03510 [Clostridia bacterium]|nr:hypothetical protein [Clostridia bacterium]